MLGNGSSTFPTILTYAEQFNNCDKSVMANPVEKVPPTPQNLVTGWNAQWLDAIATKQEQTRLDILWSF